MNKLWFFILVLVFTACSVIACGPEARTASPTISTFEASPSSISEGANATLTWNVSGATKVAIDQGIGNVALSGSRAVTPTTNTIYTLTATNADGISVTATTQVMVSAMSTPEPTPTPTPTPTPPTPSPTPTPPAAVMPIISYFIANPPSIIAGYTTTLGWSVSNATAVNIDQGIGDVGLVGTEIVSPAATTNYTLTATNAAGWTAVTITVAVSSAPPPEGKPDLVILDISRSGDTINYKISNQGTATAGASKSVLTVDGVVKGYDSVGPLNAGATSNRSFATYTYSCSLPGDTLAVQADKDNVVAESIEGNNAFSKTWSCLMIIPHFEIEP